MKLKHTCIIFVLSFIIFHTSQGQPVFSDKTKQYKNQIPTRSVMPGGAMDLDGDLVDDLIILDKGNNLKIVKSSGQFFELKLLDSVKTVPSKEWTLTAGDLDNNGSMEVITAGEYNSGSIVSIKNNQPTRRAFFTGIYAQASNTIDINNDGWLDYFVCNDDGPSKIYMNDGTGNLLLKNIIDFSKNDPTDGSGNYGSVWVDVNGDFLPDLCLSKCRAGVDSPTDLRRVNRLYINKGNAVFEEQGAAFGLNSGEQTWVTAFGDIDNDGDQDALVVNHYGPHELMENIDGQSFKKLALPEILSSFSFQAVMQDYDNDGWLDIMLVGVEGSILLHNNGNKSFTIIKNIIGPGQPRSMTNGDFNDDGFVDIHAHMGLPINDVGPQQDQLWLNQPNGNHYIKLNLKGNISNASAVGAQLELYGSWGRQIRYIKGGESYGIFNSLQQVFGLGLATLADSLVVRWPSGLKEKYESLSADETYFVQEGKCLTKQVTLYTQPLISKDTAVTLSALGGYTSYLWSQGNLTEKVEVMPGTYHVSMTDTNGCISVSKPISVLSGCFQTNVKLIQESNDIIQCAGQSTTIYAVPAASYLWQNGSTASSITMSATSWVILEASDFCGRTLTDSLYFEAIQVDWAVKGDTVVKGESAILVSTNPNTFWYALSDLNNPLFTGDTLFTSPLSVTTGYKAKTIDIIDKKEASIGEKSFPFSNFYGSNNTAGGLIFMVEKPCVLHSVSVNTDLKGLRRIIITDSKGDVVFSKDIYLESGITSIILDARLVPGTNYRMLTDESVNIQSFGHKSPRLVRTFNNTSFPYSIENTITILSSTFGASYFLYFYNWEIHYDIVSCESELRDVVAYVEMENSTSNGLKNPMFIYPNPTTEKLIIKGCPPIFSSTISTIDHHLILVNENNVTEIDVAHLPKGVYILTVKAKDQVSHLRWVKQ